jgi:hypothetical protein
MPLPKPKDGENKKKFIDRCMSNPTMTKEFSDPSQRRAVCEKQWKGKANEDAHKMLQALVKGEENVKNR